MIGLGVVLIPLGLIMIFVVPSDVRSPRGLPADVLGWLGIASALLLFFAAARAEKR